MGPTRFERMTSAIVNGDLKPDRPASGRSQPAGQARGQAGLPEEGSISRAEWMEGIMGEESWIAGGQQKLRETCSASFFLRTAKNPAED